MGTTEVTASLRTDTAVIGTHRHTIAIRCWLPLIVGTLALCVLRAPAAGGALRDQTIYDLRAEMAKAILEKCADWRSESVRNVGGTAFGIYQHPYPIVPARATWRIDLPSSSGAPLAFTFGTTIIAQTNDGVRFAVEVNGVEVWQRVVEQSQTIARGEVDLTQWSGTTISLTLIIDPHGDNKYDWAVWLEPRIVARGSTDSPIDAKKAIPQYPAMPTPTSQYRDTIAELAPSPPGHGGATLPKKSTPRNTREGSVDFTDDEFWTACKESGFRVDYEQYIARFPHGMHAGAAKGIVARLRKLDAMLGRLTGLINEEYGQYGVNLSYRGFKNGEAHLAINQGGQDLGTLLDIAMTGNLERVAERQERLGTFVDGVRSTFLTVPGVTKVMDRGQELQGGSAKPWRALLQLAREVQVDAPIPADPTETPRKPDVPRASTSETARAVTQTTRWVYGSVRFPSGRPAAKVCDIVIWTKSLLQEYSSSTCTDEHGNYRIAVEGENVTAVHIGGRKIWDRAGASLKETYSGVRIDLTLQ